LQPLSISEQRLGNGRAAKTVRFNLESDGRLRHSQGRPLQVVAAGDGSGTGRSDTYPSIVAVRNPIGFHWRDRRTDIGASGKVPHRKLLNDVETLSASIRDSSLLDHKGSPNMGSLRNV